jgi:hypothetical protein
MPGSANEGAYGFVASNDIVSETGSSEAEETLDILEVFGKFFVPVLECEFDASLEGQPGCRPFALICDGLPEKLLGDLVKIDVVPFKYVFPP